MIVRAEGRRQREIPLPVVSTRINNHALHRGGSVITFPTCRLAGKEFRNHHTSAIRIKKYLGRIETQATLRGRRPNNSVAIELARRDARNEAMPVVVPPIRNRIERNHTRWLGVVFTIEEDQLNTGCRAREQTEIDAAIHNRGAQRRGTAFSRIGFLHCGTGDIEKTLK